MITKMFLAAMLVATVSAGPSNWFPAGDGRDQYCRSMYPVGSAGSQTLGNAWLKATNEIANPLQVACQLGWIAGGQKSFQLLAGDNTVTGATHSSTQDVRTSTAAQICAKDPLDANDLWDAVQLPLPDSITGPINVDIRKSGVLISTYVNSEDFGDVLTASAGSRFDALTGAAVAASYGQQEKFTHAQAVVTLAQIETACVMGFQAAEDFHVQLFEDALCDTGDAAVAEPDALKTVQNEIFLGSRGASVDGADSSRFSAATANGAITGFGLDCNSKNKAKGSHKGGKSTKSTSSSTTPAYGFGVAGVAVGGLVVGGLAWARSKKKGAKGAKGAQKPENTTVV